MQGTFSLRGVFVTAAIGVTNLVLENPLTGILCLSGALFWAVGMDRLKMDESGQIDVEQASHNDKWALVTGIGIILTIAGFAGTVTNIFLAETAAGMTAQSVATVAAAYVAWDQLGPAPS